MRRRLPCADLPPLAVAVAVGCLNEDPAVLEQRRPNKQLLLWELQSPIEAIKRQSAILSGLESETGPLSISVSGFPLVAGT